MKNLILAFTLFALTLTVGAHPTHPLTKGRSAKEVIKETVVYPQFAIEQGLEGTVWMRLQIDQNGRVEVVKANSTNNDLLRYAVDKVENLNLAEGQYEAGQPFNLKFDFVLL